MEDKNSQTTDQASNKELTFGSAIQALKNGKRVAREGWNGKGMFIYLNKGSFDFSIPSKDILSEECFTIGGVCQELFEKGDGGTITRMPNLNMKAADNSIVTGWLASQTDILAEDWNILD